MRLLLDEHFPRELAAELRERGHDVAAINEQEELRGLPDAAVFAHAAAERRAIVTQNYADFSILLREAAVSEAEHFGVVFVPSGMWRSLRDRDQLVEALSSFLAERPSDHALARGAAWLEG